MNATQQRIALWVALAGVVLAVIGLVGFADFVPPPSPALDPADVVQLYQTDTNMKRLGFMLIMAGYGFYFGFVAVIYAQMQRIEGAPRFLSSLQLCVGGVNALLLLLPSLLFTAAAYRPDRNPEVTVALHDIAWFTLVMPVTSFMLQQFTIAAAIFSDKSARPVFPRWIGYMNVWVALLYAPALMDTFFKHGPFAWDGILAFWIPLMAFLLIWIPIMYVALFKAIRQEESEAAPISMRAVDRVAA